MSKNEREEVESPKTSWSLIDSSHLPLNRDGIDQCIGFVLGALKFQIRILSARTQEADSDEELALLVAMMEEQANRVGAFMDRLSRAMYARKTSFEDNKAEGRL